MGWNLDELPVRRPAYLDAAPLLPPAPPSLDGRHLLALFRELWARRDEADHYVRQEPYTGGLIRAAQALRQAPNAVALSYTLSAGDPADPEVAYQVTRAVQGVKDAGAMFGMTMLDGDIRFEAERGLHPELEVFANSVMPAGRTAVLASSGTQPSIQLGANDVLAVAGRMTNDLSGSLALEALAAWPQETFGSTLGVTNEPGQASLAPPLDLVAEQRMLDFIRQAKSLLSGATPLGRGGLLVTLARCCARSRMGAAVQWPNSWRELAPVAALFGEAQSRFLLAFSGQRWPALVEAARPLEVALQELGAAGGANLTVNGAINLNLGRVKAWS